MKVVEDTMPEKIVKKGSVEKFRSLRGYKDFFFSSFFILRRGEES
jgi:hypothetical protein